MLNMTYQMAHREIMLQNYTDEEIQELVTQPELAEKRKQKVLEVMAQTDELPSPAWVAHHGMNAFIGGIKVRPQDGWAQARADKWAQIKEIVA
jgi:hypothetical protein